MKYCFEIADDLFDVALRIRAIDQDYKIYYNTQKKAFELHNIRFKPSFQLVLPYDRLDKRSVDYVYATRVERIFDKLACLEYENQALVERNENAKFDETQYKIKQVAKYLYGGGEDIPSFHTI